MAHAAHGIGTATAIRPVQHILFPSPLVECRKPPGGCNVWIRLSCILPGCVQVARTGRKLAVGCDHSHTERFLLLLSVGLSVSQDEPSGNFVQGQDFIVSFRHFLAFPFTSLLEKKSIAFMRNARIIKTS